MAGASFVAASSKTCLTSLASMFKSFSINSFNYFGLRVGNLWLANP